MSGVFFNFFSSELFVADSLTHYLTKLTSQRAPSLQLSQLPSAMTQMLTTVHELEVGGGNLYVGPMLMQAMLTQLSHLFTPGERISGQLH